MVFNVKHAQRLALPRPLAGEGWGEGNGHGGFIIRGGSVPCPLVVNLPRWGITNIRDISTATVGRYLSAIDEASFDADSLTSLYTTPMTSSAASSSP